ncbi:MAG: ABC transporter substrate-binding protein, partial [Alphaproteobacteria bacterium]
ALVAPIVAARNRAAQLVNAQGGLLDGDTYVLVLGDSACDAKAAVDAANKVVNVDQVVAVVGPNCSGATSAAAQSVTMPAGVVLLSESATSPAISDLADGDTVFRVAPSDSFQGRSIAEQARAAGYQRVAVTFANDDYNSGLAQVFINSFQDMGGTVVASQMHEPDKASYRSELATLAADGNPQALMVFAYYGGSGITILRNSLENELFDKFMAADGMFDNSVVEQIGAENLAGRLAVSQAASDTDSEAYQRFAQAFTAAGGDPQSPFVAHGYDAAFLMALAIQKAGSADRSLIAAALREVANAPGEIVLPGEWEKARALIAAGTDINYQGASGDIEFDANGDVSGLYSSNSVNADGSWTTKLLK